MYTVITTPLNALTGHIADTLEGNKNLGNSRLCIEMNKNEVVEMQRRERRQSPDDFVADETAEEAKRKEDEKV